MSNYDIKKITHIDCTLRDGGYYNNWDFEDKVIKDYLNALSLTSINYVEIGFRNITNDNFKGALAFSKDEYLNSINIPDNINLGVMINSSQLIDIENYIKILEILFPNNSLNSPVKLVRIATNINLLDISLLASIWLKEKGFKVGINITKISKIYPNELKNLIKEICKYKLDVLYFADTLGSMTPINVKEIMKIIKDNCNTSIGIHTHDNLGLALSNTLVALDNGVDWIDSTILGMGRGPGNCKTEELLIELNNSKNLHKISPILDTINNHFFRLKDFYKWGSNSYYYLGGKYEIHPSYIQEIIKDKLFSSDDKLALIKKLKNKNSQNYSSNYNISEIIEYDLKKHKSEWDPKDLFLNKNVLILSTGPSSKKYSNSIEKFIQKINPIVIALNTPTPIENNLINLRSACHPLRILTDGAHYKDLNQPLICPYSMIKNEIDISINRNKILDYGLSIEIEKYIFKKNYCIIPNPLVLFYTISCSISGGAKSIAISGVDGYADSDARNELNNNLFKEFNKNIKNKIPIYSITPSNYRNLDKKSIFGF